MVDGFNLQDSEEAREKVEENREKKKEEFQYGTETFNLSNGLNILHVVPALGDMIEHVPYKSIHFRPFHICGRPDPVPDEGADNGYEKGGSFEDCYRCQKAWDRFEDAGQPSSNDHPAKQKFMSDMPNDRAVMQVVDFTPFFGWKNSKKKNLVEPKKEVIDRWLGPYLKLVLGKEDEIPEDMPEDMAESAELCPSVMNVSIFSVGKDVLNKFESLRDLKGTDPFGRPDRFLLTIHRTNSGQTFSTASGEVEGKDYNIDFTKEDLMDVWKDKFPVKQYLNGLLDVAVDVENMEPEENEEGEITLESRAFAMERLTNDEIREYLEEQGHSFQPESSLDPDELDDDDIGGMEDPDDFEPDADYEEQQAEETALTLEDVSEEELEEDLEDL